MFEVYILTPYVSTLCVATFSRVLTSLSLDPVRDYGLHIVTTRPKSKRCMRLHPELALAVSPCAARSSRCHPKHGVAIAHQPEEQVRLLTGKGLETHLVDDHQARLHVLLAL